MCIYEKTTPNEWHTQERRKKEEEEIKHTTDPGSW